MWVKRKRRTEGMHDAVWVKRRRHAEGGHDAVRVEREDALREGTMLCGYKGEICKCEQGDRIRWQMHISNSPQKSSKSKPVLM